MVRRILLIILVVISTAIGCKQQSQNAAEAIPGKPSQVEAPTASKSAELHRLMLLIKEGDFQTDVPRAVAELESIGADATPLVDALIELVESDDPTRRLAAALWVLGSIGPPAERALPILEANTYRCDDARAAILRYYAMARISQRDDGNVAALADAARQSSDGIALTAIAALGKLGPLAHSAIPALAQAIDLRSTADVRLELVKVLDSFGDAATPALFALESATKDEDAFVRKAAFDAIHNIKQAGGGK